MWYTWTTLLLVSCALVKAEGEAGAEAPTPAATTRAPPRTLDRKAAELVWKSWLESPEGNNRNAPPRRITTKSLFITPLVCPKGQRLDRNACIQVITVNKDEHDRTLQETLNALFTTPPNEGHGNADTVVYDYGDDDPGPLQLTIPIGYDPQAAPLQGQEPSAQAQELQPSYVKLDKKDGNKQNDGGAIEAELELLKLQSILNQNDTTANVGSDILNQNVLTNIHTYPEKPKRDSPIANLTEIESPTNTTDQGQKELVYGHVNVDPILYSTEDHDSLDTEISYNSTEIDSSEIAALETITKNLTSASDTAIIALNDTKTDQASNSTVQILKKDSEQSKLNPENDYSDIGEAIKLISRYADVTTDDNFAKEQNKNAYKEDSFLGTRTKMQHRRNKPKDPQVVAISPVNTPLEMVPPSDNVYQSGVYYRYPWQSQHTQTPPPNYPFRHLQDYWPGRNQVGGVYNTHENPRRHHHSYPHNFRAHGYLQSGFGAPPAYPEQLKTYIRRAVQHHATAMRPHTDNQDLYSLLGLRHWFSSEGTSKR